MARAERLKRCEERGMLTRERIGYALGGAAQRWPDRELMLIGGSRYTYRDFWRWTTIVAHDLIDRGLRPGDRIVLQMGNSIEFLALQFAIWRIGCVSVPAIPAYRRHEMSQIIADVKPRAIAGARRIGQRDYCVELEEIVAEQKLDLLVKYAGPSAEGLNGWVPVPERPADDVAVSEEGLYPPAAYDECVLILYTSGTTSAPKGAMLAGSGIIANTLVFRLSQGTSERDVYFTGSPLAHIAALMYGVTVPMMIGARSVIMTSWNPDEAVALIEREHANFAGGSTIFLRDLVERYERGEGREHRLSSYGSGGAATPPSLIERAEALGMKVFRGYGMTEASGSCALSHRSDPLERRAHYDGRLLFGTEMQAVDADRRPLPPGESGELRVRNQKLLIGYTDPAATAAYIDEDGWFYTGDVGFVDADGWVKMTGRLKDIINRGGEKFSTQDIEDAIASHPDVSSIAVVGAPDERFGEVVAAFLTLKSEVSWQGPEPILRHLEAAKLAKQKFPVIWRVLGELPTSSTGKVRKQALLDMLADR